MPSWTAELHVKEKSDKLLGDNTEEPPDPKILG